MADISKLSIAADQDKSTPEQKPGYSMTIPGPRRSQPMARDITADFSAAASALNTGQLVKDEDFTLFEAVGALEIMDPKMDSGFLKPGETLEDDYDVLRELLPEEVLGIMDQMLCYEMAWHMGHPLSQSLFTSLYLDRLLWPEPKTLEGARFDRDNAPGLGNEMLHVVLRAFCLGLIKTCDFVHRRISMEHYYEEEDFVANLYHRKLLTDFEVANLEKTLDDAALYLDGEATIPNKTLRDALVNRLELRKSMLSAVQIDGIVDPHRVTFWKRCLELLPGCSKTSTLGTPIAQSFSIKIQRRLASSVPPRPIVNISHHEAFVQFTSLCQNAKDAYRIFDYHGGNHLMTFVSAYQSRIPQPCVYVRSLMQSMVFNEMRVLGTMSFKQLIFDDLEEIVLPADVLVDSANGDVEAPQDPRFQMAKRMDDFVTRAADPFLDILRTLCMNRSRLRRMLCHLVLDWDRVQFDAESFDTELRTYNKEEPIKESKNSSEELWAFPLSSWAYYHKLRQMEWIVQMGFELDVYLIDELGGMYWYLQHLTSTRIQHLERIRTFTTRRLARISKPTPEQKTAFRRSFSFLDFAMLDAAATASFAEGLSCVFSFLSHLGLIPAPYHARPYSTPALRYNLRMRPFLSISLPEVPSYPEFASLVSLRTPDKTNAAPATQPEINEQASQMLELADQALKAARREWEAVSKVNAETARCVGCEDWWRTSVKNVLRGCITANIMVSTAKKAVVSAGSKDPKDVLKVEMVESGKGYHPWWVVPKISAK